MTAAACNKAMLTCHRDHPSLTNVTLSLESSTLIAIQGAALSMSQGILPGSLMTRALHQDHLVGNSAPMINNDTLILYQGAPLVPKMTADRTGIEPFKPNVSSSLR